MGTQVVSIYYVNNSAVKTGWHISLRYSVFSFFTYKLRRGIARSHARCVFNFWGISMLLIQFMFPPTGYKSSLFSTSLPNLAFESQCRLAPADCWCVVCFSKPPENPHMIPMRERCCYPHCCISTLRLRAGITNNACLNAICRINESWTNLYIIMWAFKICMEVQNFRIHNRNLGTKRLE